MHYMYRNTNGNSRAVLRMYHAQFPDRRMPNHIIFQRLRQLSKTRSFHVTRHEVGRRKAVRSPSVEEKKIFKLCIIHPSTRPDAHHVSVSGQTVCRGLNEKRLQVFHFRHVQASKAADDLLRLQVGGTAICTAARFDS
ncbi:hypothetical protein TNCV_3580701 [Trichonephila clavipes]|nr:hypothetical protein TNCV_3580701 [Trichonephila clavipes]